MSETADKDVERGEKMAAAAAEAVNTVDPQLLAMLRQPKSYCIYGQAKTRKSGQIAQAFQKGLFLLSSPNVLLGFASWVVKNPASGLRLPKNVVINEFKKGSADQERINNWDSVHTAVRAYMTRCDREPGTYDALIIDEMSTFAKRWVSDLSNLDLYPEMASAKTGKLDIFRVYQVINDYVRYLCQGVVQASQTNVVMVCHEVGPKYDADTGALKGMGGPDFPTGNAQKDATHDADATLRFFLKEALDGVEYWIRTAPHPEWRGGGRFSGVDPEVKQTFTELLQTVQFG